jgi:transcriptional regulator of met regulon
MRPYANHGGGPNPYSSLTASLPENVMNWLAVVSSEAKRQQAASMRAKALTSEFSVVAPLSQRD